VSLLAVNEVRELNRVFDEEDGSVISDHVVISFFSVEFNGESSWISISVRGSFFSSYCGESNEEGSLLSNLVQELCLGILCDVMSYFQITMSSCTLGMHYSLGNSFSVELS